MIRTTLMFCVFFICFVSTGYCQQEGLPVDTLLIKDFKSALSSNKNVLVIFRASWCGWCRKMDSSLKDSICRQFFDDNYIVVHLTVHESKSKKYLESPGASALMAKYNGEEAGIPFWLIFDKNGKLLADSQMRTEGEGLEKKGQNSGCPASAEEVNYFIRVLKKTSNLTDTELQLIEKRFRQNEN